MAKVVNVAVGVVLYGDKVLLARRKPDQHQGGKWEFPGGKIETDETTCSALIRELKEECAIEATQLKPLIVIEHDYGDKKVCLDTYLVTEFSGEAKGLEGQEIIWANVNQLVDYDFPKANVAILDALNQYLS
ncbi:8-oxo-dGTP diphosphatase MutT [Catenovulum sp. 2E275]|uniref:8-oxo-dGTP diphosphatase MutT n=1 Tax=Catenovulum sp. 2E275 TaxID=2980497 RepID=UPI0021CF3240|nr:8-oxo-dGTP diphosphatase MutT [Catenovulum sp. 2E275]MCU4674203.1 8-oxo-dGTP diphosphatase MutT [Catenovulum sp. 2E275]